MVRHQNIYINTFDCYYGVRVQMSSTLMDTLTKHFVHATVLSQFYAATNLEMMDG